jgi:hypothetical protein
MKNCHVCGAEVTGNLSPAATHAFKCTACVNGEVLHIQNNPEKFHVIDNSVKNKADINMRIKQKKMPKGTTLATC